MFHGNKEINANEDLSEWFVNRDAENSTVSDILVLLDVVGRSVAVELNDIRP
jgi:hypothetical protein